MTPEIAANFYGIAIVGLLLGGLVAIAYVAACGGEDEFTKP